MLQDRSHLRARAALVVLITLQVVMLGALYAQVAPHPPRAVAPFALGPFLGGSLSIALAALVLDGSRSRGGMICSFLAAATALVSFGPHKWLDAAIGEIWPAVLVAQIAVAVLVIEVVRNWRESAAG
ncbi:MAG: hypothetical protein JJ864_15045 [Rhizobiaceae bacterium]|nr:hypothetical protein [Rhizobiaceae bacterium]